MSCSRTEGEYGAVTGGTSSADVHVGVVVSAGSRFETGGRSADMMSVLERSPHRAVPGTTSAQHDPRLVFPRSPTADGVPDGGWWPRSRDPATELPMLIAAVTDRLDPVRRIALDAAAWAGRPQTITAVEGREVQLDWFGAPDAHTISLIGSHRSRLDLLMIPPDTATVLAHVGLAIAAGAPTQQRPVPRSAGVVHPEPNHSTQTSE
jgi:Family of unknown function (DUF5994)